MNKTSINNKENLKVNGETSLLDAIKLIQKDMEGKAKEVGLNNEDDVIKLIKEIRTKRSR